MNSIDLRLLALLLSGAVLLGCNIDDSERCPDGYHWRSDVVLCVADETADTDTTPIDTSAVNSSDDTTIKPRGLGESCQGDEDCAVYLDNFCLLSPLDPTAPGICSLKGCLPKDCTGDYQCCDCTTLNTDLMETDEPFCVPADSVGLSETYGCICQ